MVYDEPIMVAAERGAVHPSNQQLGHNRECNRLYGAIDAIDPALPERLTMNIQVLRLSGFMAV